MKRITAIALLAIANFAMAGSSFAQSKAVRANIPFAFNVGNSLLPAGIYTMQTESGGLIAIKNHDKPISVFTLVNQDGKRCPTGGKVMFHKIGDQYFLTEILSDSADMNVALPRSKKETKVQLQQAMVHPTSEVFIAAL